MPVWVHHHSYCLWTHSSVLSLLSKWQRLLRNYVIRCPSAKIAAQNVLCQRTKKRTGWLLVMCRQEKEQMLELLLLMTNRSTHPHTRTCRVDLQKTAFFKASFPRGWPKGRGGFSGSGWWYVGWKESSSVSWCLLFSMCEWFSVCVGVWFSSAQVLESVLLCITCISPSISVNNRGCWFLGE